MKTGMKNMVTNKLQKKFWFFCVMVYATATSAQVYTGYVFDADHKKPIPYAHIQIVKPAGNGATTATSGQFRINAQASWPQPLQVRISSVGFETKSLALQNQKTDTIFLKPQISQLEEVAITAIDYERQLLRRVIAKIPENYPNWTEHLIGAVTEKGFLDSLQTIPLYEAWAEIGADKPSYQTRQDLGNVMVRDGGVQTFKDFKETSFRIYAGIYNVHRFDAVQLRLGPLRLSDLPDYDFNRHPLRIFDGAPMLPINFKSKEFTGTIYINMTDTAVHEMHVQHVKPATGFSGIIAGAGRTYLHYKVGYSKYDGRYRLRYINYSTGFSEGNSFYLENTFSITSFEAVSKPIAEAERASFYDKLIDLVPQNLAADSSQPATTSIFQRVIGRFSFEYGYAATMRHRDAFRYTIPLGNGSISGPIAAESRWLHSIGTQANFRINNTWAVSYYSTSTRESFAIYGLGMTYRKRLGFTGKWTVSGGVFGGQLTHLTPLLNIRGADLRYTEWAGNTEAIIPVHQRELQWQVSPQIGIGYRFWKNWNFKISGTYLHWWGSKSELHYQLPRKNFLSINKYSAQPIGATNNHSTPIILQIQVIYRGF